MPKSTPLTIPDMATSILAVEALVAQHGMRPLARALGINVDEIRRWRAKGATILGAIRAEIRGICPKEQLRPDVSPLGWQRETYRALSRGVLWATDGGELKLGDTHIKVAARLRMRERGQRIRRADA